MPGCKFLTVTVAKKKKLSKSLFNTLSYDYSK